MDEDDADADEEDAEVAAAAVDDDDDVLLFFASGCELLPPRTPVPTSELLRLFACALVDTPAAAASIGSDADVVVVVVLDPALFEEEDDFVLFVVFFCISCSSLCFLASRRPDCRRGLCCCCCCCCTSSSATVIREVVDIDAAPRPSLCLSLIPAPADDEVVVGAKRVLDLFTTAPPPPPPAADAACLPLLDVFGSTPSKRFEISPNAWGFLRALLLLWPMPMPMLPAVSSSPPPNDVRDLSRILCDMCVDVDRSIFVYSVRVV